MGDLEDGKTTASSKVEESEAHDLGSTYYPVGCCEGDDDRIYCTLGSLTGSVTNNGIGYWDMDSLKFKKSTQWSTAGLAADCTVTDDHVYWTASFSGEVVSCDHDLDNCSLVTNSNLVKPSTFIGAMGIVHIEEDDEEFLVVANPDKGELVKIPVKDGALDGTPANVSLPTDSTRPSLM